MGKINVNEFAIIVNKLNKIKFLKFEKVLELVHALYALHLLTNEKIKKIEIIPQSNDLDYSENIVIGSGPAGSITANELRKNNFDNSLGPLLIKKTIKDNPIHPLYCSDNSILQSYF